MIILIQSFLSLLKHLCFEYFFADQYHIEVFPFASPMNLKPWMLRNGIVFVPAFYWLKVYSMVEIEGLYRPCCPLGSGPGREAATTASCERFEAWSFFMRALSRWDGVGQTFRAFMQFLAGHWKLWENWFHFQF